MTKHTTIDLTPTWETTARLMLTLEEHGYTAEDRQFARDEIVKMGQTLDTLIAVHITPDEPEGHTPDPQYISPVPNGYDTVLGYLATHQPEALQFDMWDAEATQRDGFWCRHQCRKRGLPICKVPAPAIFDGESFTTVNAYPLEVLQERLGGAV